MRKRQKQLGFELRYRGRGGYRPGAGRPKKPDAGVPHVRRPKLAARNPVHVTARVRDEAADAMALARGVQALSIRAARAINRVLGRRGKVFADRYHAHISRRRPKWRMRLRTSSGTRRCTRHGAERRCGLTRWTNSPPRRTGNTSRCRRRVCCASGGCRDCRPGDGVDLLATGVNMLRASHRATARC